MFDINFYMKSYDFMKNAEAGKYSDRQEALALLESWRSKEPIVYNIETTNACNMRCQMCPRTTLMTRLDETLPLDMFRHVVDQLKPHKKEDWARWEKFVEEKYGIKTTDMSENHFFLLIIPRVIQLHGYGDPLLDKSLPQNVKLLSDRGFDSYFSCNPSNINLEKVTEMFDNGLSYIKYSMETVDDVAHKAIRGKASDFTRSYQKICKLLELKRDRGYKTTIIITMLDLNRKNQQEDFANLRKAFEGKDVYVYLKSEDQQWYRGDYHPTKSVHWSEFCKHPWMSMTVKSNGEIAMCMEDFDNEIVLGDIRTDNLHDIWNGKLYDQLRHDHFTLNPCIKCTARCDMSLIGELIGNNGMTRQREGALVTRES
jgi:radical SAM protein with 4Fe4S-binding SPASM domain